MAMKIDRIYKQPTRPYLFDRVIQSVQDSLGQLPWLTHIFGRSERLVKTSPANGQRIVTPNVYYKKGEYLSLLPDNRELGNYAFFVLEDPQQVTVPMGNVNRVKAPYSLIVWVDMRTVGATYDDRNTEQLKEALLKTVRRAWLRHGNVNVSKVYQRAENVFSGYTLNEVDNQYLMAPYAGFRLTGEMQIDEECDAAFNDDYNDDFDTDKQR